MNDGDARNAVLMNAAASIYAAYIIGYESGKTGPPSMMEAKYEAETLLAVIEGKA